MSFTRTLRESVLQIFVCNEREEKNGAEKTTGEDGNGVSFFFLERERERKRDTNRKEKACVKRTKEGERDRNGAEKERA